MFHDPVIEQFRLNPSSTSYSGVFTLAYPSKNLCIVLGFLSATTLKPSQIKQLKSHVKSKGRKEVVFYREQNGTEIEKRFKL